MLLVESHRTHAADVVVLRWMGAHQQALVTSAMLEITALGTGLVVFVIAGTAALFLALTTRRRGAALLPLVALGAMALFDIVKHLVARPRPHVFPWDTLVHTTSFPSGHATNSLAVYGALAFVAVRLEHSARARWLTALAAGVIVVLVCVSRLYLGVHYPSDILGGLAAAAGWLGVCGGASERWRGVRFWDANSRSRTPGDHFGRLD